MRRPGPNACYCRMCIMSRWRSANRHRRNKGVPPLPRPEIPPKRGGPRKPGEGCPCNVCEANRRNALKIPRKDEQLLDRRALDNWPEEWGRRSA